MRAVRTALAAWLLLWTLPGLAAAQGTVYSQVLAAYQANGSVPPCQFTSAQLQQALKGVDTYGEQYFADFTNAVQTALSARASGACSPGARSLGGRAQGAGSAFTAPGVTAPTGSGLPAPIAGLAALTLVLAAGGGLVMAGRSRGWDPRWLAWVRHAAGEAAYRAGSRRHRLRR
jgi:hypothetical protein